MTISPYEDGEALCWAWVDHGNVFWLTLLRRGQHHGRINEVAYCFDFDAGSLFVEIAGGLRGGKDEITIREAKSKMAAITQGINYRDAT